MTPHTDILDQPEPLGKPLAGSVALHISVAVAVLISAWIGRRVPVEWGDINGGGMGSVAVSVVARVPLPGRSGPINPVANDTESVVPTPPSKAKPRSKVEAPEPNAIAIKSRNAQRKASRAASAPNKFRDQQQDLPNQVYSTSGQAAVSPMYGMTGGGGVGIGNNSPFGAEFGWYVNLLRDQVARNWRTSDLDPRLRTAPQVWVTFTIRRDGSVPPGSVRITQRSGNQALDFSAQRAILDAAPFQALPPRFQRNDVEIEFRFELRR